MKQPDSPTPLYGGSGNRIIAVLLDVTLLILLTSILSGMVPLGPYTLPLLAWLYLAVLPLTPLQGSLGKWICRIRLCDRLGARLTWRATVLRSGATVLWFCLPAVFNQLFVTGATPLGKVLSDIWWLLFLIPWASVGFRPRHESAFDLISGSLVVTLRAKPQHIAHDKVDRKLHLFSGTGILLLGLAMGAIAQSMIDIYTARSLHGRVVYAIEQTMPLRLKIEEFRTQMHRWPTASDLGIPTPLPYRDGGNYSLQTQGSIVIRFSVLPELKGRGLTFTPSWRPNEGRINWVCSVDHELDKRYLPSACR